MWVSYKQILQFFFPPSTDELLLRTSTPGHFRPRPVHVDSHTTALLPYTDQTIRAAIHLAKFHHHPEAIRLLGSTLAAYSVTHPNILVVPIPLSKQRERARGYNQVTEIIRSAKHTDPQLHYAPLLTRTRHTPPQTSLTKKARCTNMQHVFSIRSSVVPEAIHTTHIVILDDVVTTGSTLQAAYQALKPLKPASLSCLALAH